MKWMVMVALLGMVLAACTTPTADTTNGEPQNTQATVAREISVTAFQWGFEPSTITIKKGERVRITFTSKDVPHGVLLPELGIETPPFAPGNPQTIEFTADKTGTFTYSCSVYCGDGHRGMTGQIVIEE